MLLILLTTRLFVVALKMIMNTQEAFLFRQDSSESECRQDFLLKVKKTAFKYKNEVKKISGDVPEKVN